MKASESVKAKIGEWEGLRLRAYRCPAGVLTIGYGHTGPDVTEGMRITSMQAKQLLDQDVDKIARQIKGILPYGINLKQYQFDAVVSFAFNAGVGALRGSALFRKLCANPSDPSIADEFLRWNKAGGQVMPGLVKRRLWESQLYLGKYE